MENMHVHPGSCGQMTFPEFETFVFTKPYLKKYTIIAQPITSEEYAFPPLCLPRDLSKDVAILREKLSRVSEITLMIYIKSTYN
jgi:hypothetical protein